MILNRTLEEFANASPERRAAEFSNTTPEVAVQQARDLVDSLKEEYSFTEDEAKQHIAAQIAKAAEEKGGDPDEVFANYPPELQRFIVYKPSDLKKNQNVTQVGLILAPLLFATGGSLVALAAFRGLAAAAPFIAEALALSRTGKSALQVANLIALSKAAAFPKVVKLGVLGAVATGLAWYASTAVNNWNDVFHWGKFQQQQLTVELEKLRRQQGFGAGGGGYTPQSKTRVSSYTTAKPKLFIGPIFNGRVAVPDKFVRSVDDKITSDEDLKDDVEINLVRYLAKLPNNLTYTIGLKNNAMDEFGVPQIGTWATLTLYLSNVHNKRIFIDEILLGPVDPVVYYPESQRVEQLQYEIPKLVKFDTLKPLQLPSGVEFSVDTAGNVVSGFFDDKPTAISGGNLPTAAGPAAVAAASPTAKPIVMDDSYFIHPDGSPAQIWRGVGDELWVFNVYDALTTAEEKQQLAPRSDKFSILPEKLKARGVNFSSIRTERFITDRIVPAQNAGKYHSKSFEEFFGVAPESSGTLVKTVQVTVPTLFVRGAPNTQAPLAGSQRLNNGDVFAVVEIVGGESVEGNNKWWKSAKGNFVWSGGTTSDFKSVEASAPVTPAMAAEQNYSPYTPPPAAKSLGDYSVKEQFSEIGSLFKFLQ